jgi:hypothetical protein
MASKTTPPPTIGWIGLHQKEFRAALAILDETYDNVALARGEGNRSHYVLGLAGEHYVVINLPPPGWTRSDPRIYNRARHAKQLSENEICSYRWDRWSSTFAKGDVRSYR